MKNKSKNLSTNDNNINNNINAKNSGALNDGINNDTVASSKSQDIGTKDNEYDSEITSQKFLTFTFYKVDPKWRWLNEMGKDEASREFLELLQAASKRMKIRTYSTLGLRHESEFMIWTISQSLENIQVLSSKIYTTILGKYIEPVSTFLSLTRKSIYSNQVKRGFEMDQDPLQYVVVYPFIKSREWYLLPFEERKEMMEEHIKVGRKYPEIVLNTTYSFGIDDQDFMLAFETNSLSRFQDLIMELRETKVSRYIIKDTPMIPCVRKDMADIIKSLG
ncbi:chlorite dismutase family protein [Candidatus Nitrosocosmicus franklandus]|uniref:Chlorite dismutase n=1 Tax=Candidatus Nitrosocosmicus franklandianus TaxID=1798806 RepID=A0A484IAN2_9ARCH|nr:chlorite dismutase family protein [Candidatus Nitrosocosmicus franklandus]VFJ13892.1 Chlorite dismutase [Candidatus Nitrosocosmicus franklandus]